MPKQNVMIAPLWNPRVSGRKHCEKIVEDARINCIHFGLQRAAGRLSRHEGKPA
jgi:hypothetical protein